MKRLLYNLLPNGLQEKLKLRYYNAKNNKYSFCLKNRLYITSEIDSWEVTTKKPMYFIVKDIDRYEKFYKIKSSDIVIDAGANDGSLAVVYSQKVGYKGKVYAFEPDAINMEQLKYNISLNKKYNNVELVKKALWNKEDNIEFFEAGTVGSSVFYEDKSSKKVIIQALSIDDFIGHKKITRLDFIKMDIEGAEIEALDGSMETIKKFSPDFAIASYHIVNDKPTYIAIEAFFKRIGYPYKTEFFSDGEIMTYAGNNIKQ